MSELLFTYTHPTLTGQPDMWRDQALCAQVGGDEIWFPDKGASTKAAKRICDACPVRAACLADALGDPHDTHGVRGGLSVPERNRIRRTR